MDASNTDDEFPAKKVLDDLKNIKSREEDEIYNLETKIEEVEKTENCLKDVVKTLEDTVREDKLKLNSLEMQLMDGKSSYDSEKLKWMSSLKEANVSITSLSKELHIISSSELKEKDEQMSYLRRLWKGRKIQYEADHRKQMELIEEANRKHQDLLQEINNTVNYLEYLEKELGLQKVENVKLKSGKEELEKMVLKLEGVSSQKNDFIKELEATVKLNREVLYTDKELDSTTKKLKAIRSENKHFKLVNVAYEEENEKLAEESRQLNKALDDLPLEENQDQMSGNRKSEQDNKKVIKHVQAQAAYQEKYEAVQKELDEIKAKAEVEREIMVARVIRLEFENQSDEAKLTFFDRVRVGK